MPVTPLQLGQDLLDRAEAMTQLVGDPLPGYWDVEDDVLRAAWTFIGASVDTYFHERVRGALLSQPLSASASKFDLPLEQVEELVTAFLNNRSGARPRVRLKKIVHDMLLKQTFQGSRNIEKAFALMGVKGYWATIATALGAPTSEIKFRLDSQYDRRNRITHQGDYPQKERRQVIKYTTLEKSKVEAELSWTRRFLDAADQT